MCTGIVAILDNLLRLRMVDRRWSRIRLWGIDAPESDQLCRNGGREHYHCGQIAANDLDAFIARRPVKCIEVDRDQYKRAVAVCTVAGIDLADWMVRSGLGLDWPTYSQGNYADAQNEAKRAERGLWSGGLVGPLRLRLFERPGGLPGRWSVYLDAT